MSCDVFRDSLKLRWLFSSLILLLSSNLLTAQTLADVDQISIVYINSYYGGKSVTLFQKLITQEQGRFIANTKQVIEPRLIQNLLDAIADVKESGDSKSCAFYIDDISTDYEIEITYEDNRHTYLHSDCGLPWNVIINDHPYVQYNGKILEAYNQLLSTLDKEYNGSFTAKDFYGEIFYIDNSEIEDGYYFPDFYPPVNKTDFSELTAYQKILNGSKLFARRSEGGRSTIVSLYCRFEENNQNCDNITGVVEITTPYNTVHKLEVDFGGDKVIGVRDYLEER
jgi:hypothetical protein